MSEHVPFPEDDRSRTPFHGDPRSQKQRYAERKAGIFAPEIDLTSDDEVEVAVANLLGDIAEVDECPACWQRTFCPDAGPCSRHDI